MLRDLVSGLATMPLRAGGPTAAGNAAVWLASRMVFTATRAFAAALVVALAGCSSPQPVAPVVVSEATLDGGTVRWVTTQPALGAVRWSMRPRGYDHVSYPAAPIADRVYRTDHSVPLLAVAAGDSVYLQVMSRTLAGTLVTGARQAFRVASRPEPRPLLEWTMIDVGFGDAHLLTMPTTGSRVLVDAGERRDAANVERFLDDHSVARLDAVLMTHAHEDHIGGMVGERYLPGDGVLGTRDVGALIEGPAPSAARSAYDELVTLCSTKSIPRRAVEEGDAAGDNAALTWDPQVGVRVLHAGGGRGFGGADEGNWLNDDSIVLRVTFGAVSLVMGGDAESPVTTHLLAQGVTLDASVLKVHHHGSANASDEGYLVAIHPRVGMVPMSRYESFGGTLPSAIVLQRLRDLAVDVYASDRAEPLAIVDSGDAGRNVTLLTDGTSYEIAVAPSASRHWSGTEARAEFSRRLP